MHEAKKLNTRHSDLETVFPKKSANPHVPATW